RSASPTSPALVASRSRGKSNLNAGAPAVAFSPDANFKRNLRTSAQSRCSDPVLRRFGDQVRHDRRLFANVETERDFLNVAVVNRRSLVLAQMLQPRFHNESLDEARRLGDVAVKSPAHRTIAQPVTPHFLHRALEVARTRCID